MGIFTRQPRRTLCFHDPANMNNYFDKECIKLAELEDCILTVKMSKEQKRYLAWRQKVIFKDHKRSRANWERAEDNPLCIWIDNPTVQKTETIVNQETVFMTVLEPKQEDGGEQTTAGTATAKVLKDDGKIAEKATAYSPSATATEAIGILTELPY